VESGWIASVAPAGVAVVFGGRPAALLALADRLLARGAEPAPPVAAKPAPPSLPVEEAADEEDAGADEGRPAGTIYAQLDALSPSEKMRVALSGNREERFALLRDTNKVLHVYVLRNPRMGLDEVQYAAKLTNLSPDALKFISEHPEWGQNATVCSAIVRNPKTPMTIAIRLLDRVPQSDLRTIARGGARQPIVQAARKKLNL
jgi:hypothetical protein